MPKSRERRRLDFRPWIDRDARSPGPLGSPWRRWCAGAGRPRLAACGAASGRPRRHHATSADAALRRRGTTVLSAMQRLPGRRRRLRNDSSSPVVCLEAADHTLGDKIHTYANLLARHEHASPRRAADLTAALNAAQTLANSLEILGDAQPTQANYDQVLNTFNVNAAITAAAGRRDHAERARSAS